MIREIKIKKFLEAFMNKANEIMNVYDEEAPTDAHYPYGVVPSTNFSKIDEYGFQGIIDIEIYVSELSESEAEIICDNLRIGLDGYYYNSDDASFHIGYESQNLIKEQEQDISYRRITFFVRIF